MIYNVLRLTGVARPGLSTTSLLPLTPEESEMQVSEKDLFVSSDDCVSQRCSKSGACDDPLCRICKDCLSEENLADFTAAYLEHINKHICKRIYPPGTLAQLMFKFSSYKILQVQ